jgi:hypothetical protein
MPVDRSWVPSNVKVPVAPASLPVAPEIGPEATKFPVETSNVPVTVTVKAALAFLLAEPMIGFVFGMVSSPERSEALHGRAPLPCALKAR